ncbi:MAG: hypothetical protein ACREJM_10175 [Candidatus Saccharimonadales bacterium]
MILWAMAGFACYELAFFVVAPWWHPDREYAARLVQLQARLAEQPGRPLMLVIGSSRCVLGFQPQWLPKSAGGQRREPLVFNFSHTGAGPLLNLLEVRRLLRAGIRPQTIVLEVMPPYLANEWRAVYAHGVEAADAAVVHRSTGDWSFVQDTLRWRLAPWYYCRQALLGRWAPRFTSGEFIPVGPWGSFPHLEESVADHERQRRLRQEHDAYIDALQNFAVSDSSRRAMHELADLCRREQIELTLLLTPEGSDFRHWYRPEARGQVDRFCAELRGSYELDLIDARDWLSDDQFSDSHHMLAGGAQEFTRRLAAQVLPQAMADRQPRAWR